MPGLKTSMDLRGQVENDIFLVGLENRAGHPHQEYCPPPPRPPQGLFSLMAKFFYLLPCSLIKQSLPFILWATTHSLRCNLLVYSLTHLQDPTDIVDGKPVEEDEPG